MLLLAQFPAKISSKKNPRFSNISSKILYNIHQIYTNMFSKIFQHIFQDILQRGLHVTLGPVPSKDTLQNVFQDFPIYLPKYCTIFTRYIPKYFPRSSKIFSNIFYKEDCMSLLAQFPAKISSWAALFMDDINGFEFDLDFWFWYFRFLICVIFLRSAIHWWHQPQRIGRTKRGFSC